MTIGISNKALGHLSESVGASDTTMKIGAGDAQAFTNAPGEYIYALVRSTLLKEIVRIDIAASQIEAGTLVVARGQGGSVAQDWPQGTLLLAVTNADHYNSIQQRGKYREIDYNPNEVLTPLFAGEKVYQNGPAGCERWWKSYDDTNPYWDIITGLPCGSEIYKDIGWTFDLLVADELICWNQYFIPALWDVLSGTWTGTTYTHSFWVILEATAGSWQIGFRPPLMRISRADSGDTNVTLRNTSNGVIVTRTAFIDSNGAVFELDWFADLDMERLTIQRSGGSSIEVSNIEFFECDKESQETETSDGYANISAAATWAGARDAAAADAINNSSTNGILAAYFSGGNYGVYRLFYFFDLSGITLTNIHTVSLRTRTYSITVTEPSVSMIAVACDTGPPLTVNHYNDGYTALADPLVAVLGEQFHYFNAFGIDYVSAAIGGMCAICVKEFTYDYSNVPPTTYNFIQLYMGEQSTSRPLLTIYGE